ncbi:hypothetical protein B0T16DRAFT_93678 [Cercophora newfieldiana]|uniref:Uncharacterized protein n=1 Tax=Cercophora newfieldiana TaxID=92897 RepID=A0AA39YG67_9PEZI|nr:hypothetical protein B0T16DRAFT_93678 [Cercophora newfieldiana]
MVLRLLVEGFVGLSWGRSDGGSLVALRQLQMPYETMPKEANWKSVMQSFFSRYRNLISRKCTDPDGLLVIGLLPIESSSGLSSPLILFYIPYLFSPRFANIANEEPRGTVGTVVMAISLVSL